ncbi:hypothetical protein D9M69_735600 [compost metagenome]
MTKMAGFLSFRTHFCQQGHAVMHLSASCDRHAKTQVGACSASCGAERVIDLEDFDAELSRAS